MAKGRMVSQSVATDKRLNELSIEAEYLFLKTIPHLDRDGLITGEAFMLLAKVCPRRQDLIPRMGELIQEWIDAELVLQYETNEGDALHFYGFTKNQTGLRYDRETPSMFAPPPGFERTDTGLAPSTSADDGQQDDSPAETIPPTESAPDLHECGQHPAELRQSDGSSPAQVEVKVEVKVEEEDQYAGASESVGSNQPETSSSSSPSISEPTGDMGKGYLGMSDNRPEWQSNRDKHLKDYQGVSAKLLVELTNELKRIRGYDALVDNPGRDSLEKEFKDEAYDLWKMGVCDVSTMKEYRDRWLVHARANKYKTLSPWPGQFYKFVVQCISGSVVAAEALRPRPSYLNIPEL